MDLSSRDAFTRGRGRLVAIALFAGPTPKYAHTRFSSENQSKKKREILLRYISGATGKEEEHR